MFRNDFFELRARLASHLRHVEKKPFKEIAAVLNLSTARASQIVHTNDIHCSYMVKHLDETLLPEIEKITRVEDLESELREIRKRINAILAPVPD